MKGGIPMGSEELARLILKALQDQVEDGDGRLFIDEEFGVEDVAIDGRMDLRRVADAILTWATVVAREQP